MQHKPKITVLGSGSSGNCYLVDFGKNDCYLLDAGVPYKTLIRKLKNKMYDVNCVCITHSHSDHAKYLKDYMQFGYKVLMSEETCKELSLENDPNIHIIKKGYVSFDDKDTVISAAPLVHDVPNIAYFLENKEGGVVYITDTCKIPYNIPKRITHWLVECNYSEEIMSAREAESNKPYLFKLNDRIRKSHLSFDTCKKYIESNIHDGVEEIYLCHLSDNNSNAEEFKKAIEQIVKAKNLNTKIFIA